MQKKILHRDDLLKAIQQEKKKGKSIVTCNGCFDILHAGHIKFLEEAKSHGDILIVAINTDAYITKKKGRGRPVNSQDDRALVLAALACVDYVAIFAEDTPIALLEELKPDVHCNGEEYGENCVEAATVRKNGGRLHLIRNYKGLSTTNILKKIAAQ
ncbi:TPA: adenylyltransferase/cytidyltransferase family protein [Candidatus Woesearchaeota archaeon]|nr:adenylyltransferase/cytidyltransferase family protein [Candidatus Woesearchaeota archaeon]HII68511.1 adenylyltransferase/cytidyltransferase family protein [Candidatus Woesearchaeota archaeon]